MRSVRNVSTPKLFNSLHNNNDQMATYCNKNHIWQEEIQLESAKDSNKTKTILVINEYEKKMRLNNNNPINHITQ